MQHWEKKKHKLARGPHIRATVTVQRQRLSKCARISLPTSRAVRVCGAGGCRARLASPHCSSCTTSWDPELPMEQPGHKRASERVGCLNQGASEYDNLQRYQTKAGGGGRGTGGTTKGFSRVPATWPRGRGACQRSSQSGGSGRSATWCPFGARHESPPSAACVECPPCRCTA